MFLSHHKVNVILASDKATDRRRAGALHEELWSQLIKPAAEDGFPKKKEINKRVEDKTERAGKKRRVGERWIAGFHKWKDVMCDLLQAAHAGAGCVLIYLGLLSHRGRGLLRINATFPSWYVAPCRHVNYSPATQTVHADIHWLLARGGWEIGMTILREWD